MILNQNSSYLTSFLVFGWVRHVSVRSATEFDVVFKATGTSHMGFNTKSWSDLEDLGVPP